MEIKKENNLEPPALPPPKPLNFWKVPASVIDLSSSSGSDSNSDGENDVVSKRRKVEELGVVLPVSFLSPLDTIPTPVSVADRSGQIRLPGQSCRQFWKAGDYVGSPSSNVDSSSGSMDHLRVHPKFLHSNATSHKWALGAFAELLDNSMDETPNGATYVNVDVLESRKDGSQMLLVEDNGGGMDPEKMRHCMSLGYSAKSKVANTIGQYGNGFKTSTMRLGADVIVFSRCQGKDGKSPTQSIGLLSYTFLRSTGKEDIVVPMLDFERAGREWKRIIRSSDGDWERNMETIVRWSPFNTVADLHSQLNKISDHGTRIIIYNLWEDDEGLLELDFNTDPHDIQLRGVNRDETNIQRAKEYPNSRHFLTYRHSLRGYASILYLRLPPGFRIILRGKDVQHHNIVNDMMMSQEITYTPKTAAEGFPKDLNFAAIVTIGFVKDARHHIDVQGFNVYHKNRLIKPFWRLWNAAGSDGRGVIGVLEANFVEPAHDKQGFERTTILARLETRLVQIQKNYWSTNCHQIGYAPRRSNKAVAESPENGNSAYLPQISWSKRIPTSSGKGEESVIYARNGYHQDESGGVLGKDTNSLSQFPKSTKLAISSLPVAEDIRGDDLLASVGRTNHWPAGSSPVTRSSGQEVFPTTSLPSNSDDTETQQNGVSRITIFKPAMPLQSTLCDVGHDHLVMESALRIIDKLRKENKELKERLECTDEAVRREPQCDKCEAFETQLREEELKFEELNKEQETLAEIFSEERQRRDNEEENLRRKLKDASNTIQELLDKVKLLEQLKIPKLEK